MDLLNTQWLVKGNRRELNIKRKDDGIIVDNVGDKHVLLIYPKILKRKSESLSIVFIGNAIKGNAPTIKLLDKKKNIFAQYEFNTVNTFDFYNTDYYLAVIYVPAKSKFELKKVSIETEEEISKEEFENYFDADVLVITPGYPSESNKYNTAFVHTKVKNYIQNGLKVDVVVSNDLPGKSMYTFDGVRVVRFHYRYLRELLSKKQYKKIMIHFFDYRYGNILDSVDVTNTELYFYMHGAECLYRDLPVFAGNYFEELFNVNNLEYDFKIRDYYLRKYNEMNNVTWIFVSDFVKNRAEELDNVKFKKYEIIPCYIDQNIFTYKKKKPELRKKIFILRKFTNDRCYALDIDIRTILELSRRDVFKELEFDIYGSGELFDYLTQPVKEFKNVHLHNEFLTHSEIKKIHDTHGIALFASRYDTQGVSLGEAASSGCVPVTSNICTISKYINPKYGTVCDVENYVEYADVIERLYRDSKYFCEVSEKISRDVSDKFQYKNTIQKEIDLLSKKNEHKFKIEEPVDNPILTIIVPSYNVEKYLHNGVISLLNQRNANKLEIIIVDDGSKDKTKEIGENLVKFTTKNNKSIVKLISKENGGHGSTINVGIENATGKYTKIMDGDDTLDSYQLANLIDILEKEDTDIILNDYIEDMFYLNTMNYKKVYPFMIHGLQYKFEDLCYPGYGFDMWGPILSCSTYKTDMLKKLNFKLLKKCFYVDMQLNTNISIGCNTIKYYPMYLYRYLLGRNGQSVSKESYMKNYKHHERVIFEIIKELEENSNKISAIRRDYIKKKLILTMIKTQYIITIEFYKNKKPFIEFESKLKEYPEFYNDESIATNGVKFHRRTKGCFIWCNEFLIKAKNKISCSVIARIKRKIFKR